VRAFIIGERGEETRWAGGMGMGLGENKGEEEAGEDGTRIRGSGCWEDKR